MGILCLISGHDDRAISLGAIKVFPLALESAWASLRPAQGNGLELPCAWGRRGREGGIMLAAQGD